MITIYLAEDDRTIRDGIKEIMEKEGGGFQIIGESNNGLETLHAIENFTFPPQILITDIKMPLMDGIELIRHIKERNWPIKIIALSGYDDYRYVRESMRYGIVDYLLKPIQKKELFRALQHITKELTNESNKLLEEQNLLMKAIAGEQAERERMAYELLFRSENGHAESYVPALEALDPNSLIILSVVEQDQDTVDIGTDLIYTAWTNQIRAILAQFDLPEHLYTCYHMNEGWIMSVGDESSFSMRFSYMQKMLRKLQHVLLEDKLIACTIGISHSHSIVDIVQAKKAARLAVNRKFYNGGGGLYNYTGEKDNYASEYKIDLTETIQELVLEMELQSRVGMEKIVARFIDDLIETKVTIQTFKELVSEFIMKLILRNAQLQDIMNHGYSQGWISRMMQCDTAANIRSVLIQLLVNVMDIIYLENKQKQAKIISDAKEYVQRNFKSNLTLKMVADHVELNPTYFSEYFKKEQGMNFIDFLIETRINAAKELLVQGNYRINEVGYQVGYDDPASFNRAFKRTMGISPSEYKKLYK